jgi:glucose/arabinose dehydrogenase
MTTEVLRQNAATARDTVPESGPQMRVVGLLAAATALALPVLSPPPAHAQDAPRLEARTEVSGLRSPWDIAFAPGGAMLFTEKCHGLSVRLPDGTVRRLMGNTADYPLRADDLFCQGQSGVHGVTVDPQFSTGQPFVYLFSASNRSTDPRRNRVIRLRVSPDWAGVGDRTDIISDIAFKETGAVGGPGAHSGGRIRFGPDGFLWVTTGDNHSATLPQDPQRLGGKVLRVDRDGRAAPGNNTPAGFDARIYTYGHRNVQGIAFRPAGQPGAGQAFTAEHGPNHSDEVTPLAAGGNAGWDPQDRPELNCPGGYCGYAGTVQTMPMTDSTRFPAAMRPAWNNRARSEGMGPAEFLDGPQWGAWNGRLAVALMRARRLDLLTLNERGMASEVQRADIPDWRIRSLVQGPDGALWGSTDDGHIVRIAPQR